MENSFGILVSGFRVLLGTMEQRPRDVRDIVFTCVVLYNMLRTQPGSADRAPTQANDVAAPPNEQVVYVPNDNYRNPSREAKHQRELLKDYFNHMGRIDWAGQDSEGAEMCQPTTPGSEEAGIHQSFLGLPHYSKNF